MRIYVYAYTHSYVYCIAYYSMNITSIYGIPVEYTHIYIHTYIYVKVVCPSCRGHAPSGVSYRRNYTCLFNIF